MAADETRTELAVAIETAVPGDLPGWRWSYTEKVADAILARFHVTERGPVSDAEVEAAARAMCDASDEHESWDQADAAERNAWRILARVALTAARAVADRDT